jgi:hypothetical protein
MEKATEKKIETATKYAQAIAKMRASGLKVTDGTIRGHCIGITGVGKTNSTEKKN